MRDFISRQTGVILHFYPSLQLLCLHDYNQTVQFLFSNYMWMGDIVFDGFSCLSAFNRKVKTISLIYITTKLKNWKKRYSRKLLFTVFVNSVQKKLQLLSIKNFFKNIYLYTYHCREKVSTCIFKLNEYWKHCNCIIY